MTGKGWRHSAIQPSARLHFRWSKLTLSNLAWPCSHPCCVQKAGLEDSWGPSLNYLMVRYWELLFALDFNTVNLSKAIFLECQRHFPNLQMCRQTCSSPCGIGVQLTWEASQIPHLGASCLPWRRIRNYYNSSISLKYASHFLQQLWQLFLLLHLIQTMSHGPWRSQGGTLALQPCHAGHRPSHQAGTNPCCPPMAADLMSPPWLGRVKEHEEFSNRGLTAHNMFLPASKGCTNSPLDECIMQVMVEEQHTLLTRQVSP